MYRRRFQPMVDGLPQRALCDGDGITTIVVGPMPEIGGAPFGGVLETGDGTEPVGQTTVDPGIYSSPGGTTATGEVAGDDGAMIAILYPSSPTTTSDSDPYA